MTEPKQPGANNLGGYLMAVFGLAAIVYCAGVGFAALESGTVTGRLGAIHASGSTEYLVSVGACGVGIALGVALVALGLRYARAIANKNRAA